MVIIDHDRGTCQAERHPPPKGGAPRGALQEEVAVPMPTKRLNVDLPVPLHTRLKVACAHQEVPMSRVVIALLEAKFPPTAPRDE